MEENPGRLSAFHGAELYSGRQLDHACSETVQALRTSGSFNPRLRMPAASGLVAHLLNTRLSGHWPGACIVRGTEILPGTDMRILFRGRQRAVRFVARHLLGTDEFERIPARARERHDIVVDDRIFGRGVSRALPALQFPAWIRQTRVVGSSWPETLAEMPKSLRKRIARLLGRNDYTLRIDCSESARQAFYHELYLPYARHRFGRDAVTLNRFAFSRQTRASALLELRSGGTRLAGTLLNDGGGTLSIGKAGFALESAASHLSDLLDYFCFLVAQLLSCKTLDFGLSRPHLEDGVLLNKAKWGTQLVSAGGLTKTIQIAPANNSDATLAFLSRNGFIERRGQRFVVRRLYRSNAGDTDAFWRLGRIAARSGLDALILAYTGDDEQLDAFAESSRAVEICRLPASDDPISAFIAHA